MMAKEAGACLAEVVRQAARCPQEGRKKGRGPRQKEQRAPSADASVNGQQQQQQALLAAIGGVGRVDAIGRMLLSALGRMKHMGGIQCTQVSQRDVMCDNIINGWDRANAHIYINRRPFWR
jgi:hypothetical protein